MVGRMNKDHKMWALEELQEENCDAAELNQDFSAENRKRELKHNGTRNTPITISNGMKENSIKLHFIIFLWFSTYTSQCNSKFCRSVCQREAKKNK